MMPPEQSVVEDLLAAHRAGRRLLLLFDYDGTLVPIAPQPWLARMDRDRRRLLERLSRQPGVVVGIISGRTIESLGDLLCLSGLCLAGTSGLELDLHGLRIVHPKARQGKHLMEDVARLIAGPIAVAAGAWLEHKGLGLTVHFRHTPPRLIEPLLISLQDVLGPLSAQIRVHHAPMALEIVAELGWNKGTAVSMIAQHLKFRDDMILYAGDSANDAEALKTAAMLGGVGIGIGPDAPPLARFRLPGPAHLYQLLADLGRRLNVVAEPGSSLGCNRHGAA